MVAMVASLTEDPASLLRGTPAIPAGLECTAAIATPASAPTSSDAAAALIPASVAAPLLPASLVTSSPVEAVLAVSTATVPLLPDAALLMPAPSNAPAVLLNCQHREQDDDEDEGCNETADADSTDGEDCDDGV